MCYNGPDRLVWRHRVVLQEMSANVMSPLSRSCDDVILGGRGRWGAP
jgi:hypothetical protein